MFINSKCLGCGHVCVCSKLKLGRKIFFSSWIYLICLWLNLFLFENRDIDFCRILGIITWLPCMITLWCLNMYGWLYLMWRSFVDHELHDCVHCAFSCISIAEYYFSPLPFFFNQNVFVVFFVFLCPSWWQKVDILYVLRDGYWTCGYDCMICIFPSSGYWTCGYDHKICIFAVLNLAWAATSHQLSHMTCFSYSVHESLSLWSI